MLDDLRQFTKQRWRKRARIYLASAGVLAIAMTAFGFDPGEQASSGGPTWMALAIGVLALVSRAMLPAAPARTLSALPVSKSLASQNRHEQDLMARNLHPRIGPNQAS